MRLLVDTNILIEELLETPVLSSLPQDETPAISVITVMELLALPGLSQREEGLIHDLLVHCLVLPVDFSIASLAGRLRRTRKKGTATDLLIAATAIISDCVLVTKNIRDFKHIPGLQLWPQE